MAGISRAERERRAAEAGAQATDGDGAQDAQQEAEAGAQPSVELVRMVRDPAQWPEPHTADVHPDEVVNVAAGGWVPA